MKHLILVTLLFFGNNLIAKQKFYKWTDADGNTHYTEKKPANKKSDEINVSTRTPPPAVVQQLEIEQNEDNIKTDETKTPEQLAVEKFNEREQERVKKKQNKANCAIAKQNLVSLQKTVRVRKKDPVTGQYNRLDDSQRVKMLKQVKDSIKDLCK